MAAGSTVQRYETGLIPEYDSNGQKEEEKEEAGEEGKETPVSLPRVLVCSSLWSTGAHMHMLRTPHGERSLWERRRTRRRETRTSRSPNADNLFVPNHTCPNKWIQRAAGLVVSPPVNVYNNQQPLADALLSPDKSVPVVFSSLSRATGSY